ncbi:hypothetical protein [Algibacter lectus]|uniref:Uncharacterized protein n=1 Tax=Algibacter lectus TaxID=221126 RepID=A0A4V3HGC6_9FLAO|nr:hypothetical protein [Algibacter lectus]MWW26064.1 hypothetical protein [Algibacter lectus]TDY60791.1 hypothetical protein DFQ06_3376 [Algibacter lectus]
MKIIHYIVILFFVGINAVNAQDSIYDELASKICSYGYSTWGNTNPTDEFDRAILREVGTDLNDPDRKKKVSDYLNKHSDILICGDDGVEGIRKREQLLKRSVSCGLYGYLQELAIDNQYSVDFNTYEIINEEKETLLDYIYLIINDVDLAGDYNILELEALADAIEEKGGKRGKDLE